MRLGEKVRVLREARGLGQSELAERVGIHQVTLSQWERGTRPFDGDYLEAVAAALDVEPGLFHSASPWERLEEAQRQYDAVIAEVQTIFKETANNTPVPRPDNTARQRDSLTAIARRDQISSCYQREITRQSRKALAARV